MPHTICTCFSGTTLQQDAAVPKLIEPWPGPMLCAQHPAAGRTKHTSSSCFKSSDWAHTGQFGQTAKPEASRSPPVPYRSLPGCPWPAGRGKPRRSNFLIEFFDITEGARTGPRQRRSLEVGHCQLWLGQCHTSQAQLAGRQPKRDSRSLLSVSQSASWSVITAAHTHMQQSAHCLSTRLTHTPQPMPAADASTVCCLSAGCP